VRCLTRAGGHWIAGEKMRDGSPDAKAALARQGRYRAVRDNLRVKEVDLGVEGRRFIVCHNPAEADRDRAERDGPLARIDANARARSPPAQEEGPRREECPQRPAGEDAEGARPEPGEGTRQGRVRAQGPPNPANSILFEIVGVDNDMCGVCSGPDASHGPDHSPPPDAHPN